MAESPLIPLSPAKKKSIRAYVILSAVAGLAIGGYFVRGYMTRNLVSTDDAQVDADVVPVAARVGGVILHMKVVDNQAVKAGQVIAEIDPRDLKMRVAAAAENLTAAKAQAAAADAQVEIVRSTSKGRLSSARAMLEGTGASVRSAHAQVASATAQVARAQSDLAKAEGDLTRAKTLHDQGAIAAQQLESAQAARDRAKAAADSALVTLSSTRDQAALAQIRIAEAQGKVDQSAPVDPQVAVATANAALAHSHVERAQTDLDDANQQLGYTTVIAPVDGFVSRLGVHDGQMVQPGTMLLMVVPARTYVVANFKETQLERIRPGDEVEVDIDASSGTFKGVVDSVAAGTGARFSMMPPDHATGNFVKVVQRVPVKITWADGQDVSRLSAGLSAEVTVHLK